MLAVLLSGTLASSCATTGGQALGFIPDAVPGNATPGELIWGQPYNFVETKARQELFLGGNLEAMLTYVRQYGGHIELWIRSSKHPDGPTRFSEPLNRLLRNLEEAGRAAVHNYSQ